MTDLLFAIPDNPVPAHAKAGFFPTRDGRRLRYALFAAEGRAPRGTIVLLQGRNEFIEKYFETIRDFSRAGFSVATFDLRGQGLSDRLLRRKQYGHVRRFADYVDDLEIFLRTIVLPDCLAPFHIVAHSTGGLIALLAAPHLTNRVERIVLSSPLLELKKLPLAESRLRRTAGLLRLFGAGGLPVGRARATDTFDRNMLTSDRRRFDRNKAIVEAHPELLLAQPTIGWVHASLTAMDRIRHNEFVASVHTPVLFIGASADAVVSTRAIENYSRRLRSAALLVIDGARHELLQEADRYREQFVAACLAFLPEAQPEDRP